MTHIRNYMYLLTFAYRYSNEYEPYARPDSNLGFINGGHPMGQYGGPGDQYGPGDDYGPPVDQYGRPLMMEEYDHYPQNYHYGPPEMEMGPEDDYEYGYSQGMR